MSSIVYPLQYLSFKASNFSHRELKLIELSLANNVIYFFF